MSDTINPRERSSKKPAYDTIRLDGEFKKLNAGQRATRASITGYTKAQNKVLGEIKENTQETIELGKKTNGRVTALETDVGPIKITHDRFMRFWSLLIFVSPVMIILVGKVAEKIIDILWKQL